MSSRRLGRETTTNQHQRVRFPGAVDSKFTNSLQFEHPSTYPAIPTYRAMDQDGEVIDPSFEPPSDELTLQMYENMVTLSIMDLIMFDAQRQGRLSFYMTSLGEEGVCVGSASALAKEDVVFAQYREAGVLMQRGFTLQNFMSQLFANKTDNGRGRNMPVHYGSKALNVVRLLSQKIPKSWANSTIAYNIITTGHANPTSFRGSIRSQSATPHEPQHTAANSRLLFRRRSSKRGRLPRSAEHCRNKILPSSICVPKQRLCNQHANFGTIPRRRNRQ